MSDVSGMRQECARDLLTMCQENVSGVCQVCPSDVGDAIRCRVRPAPSPGTESHHRVPAPSPHTRYRVANRGTSWTNP